MSRPYAALFPGQGAQVVGMGRDLVRQGDAGIQALFAAASEVAGVDLAQVALKGPDRTLAETAYLQPALTVVALALFERLTARIQAPVAVAGHSVGELPALAACGMASARDMAVLAAHRGRLMAAAARKTPGAMAALGGCDVDTVRRALEALPPFGVVDIAAVNGPTQVVISGDTDAIDAVLQRLIDTIGVKATRLRVSGAWHSPHMASAVQPLLETFNAIPLYRPFCPMVFNRDGLALEETRSVPGLLAEQLIRPVRWDKVMARLFEMGITTFVEVGPGTVLRGLVRLNNPDPAVTVHNVSDLRSLDRVADILSR